MRLPSHHCQASPNLHVQRNCPIQNIVWYNWRCENARKRYAHIFEWLQPWYSCKYLKRENFYSTLLLLCQYKEEIEFRFLFYVSSSLYSARHSERVIKSNITDSWRLLLARSVRHHGQVSPNLHVQRNRHSLRDPNWCRLERLAVVFLYTLSVPF